MPRMIVIADDFTGANDTGLQLAKTGASVTVSINGDYVECDIPVINTESRAMSPREAALAVTDAIDHTRSHKTRIVYKKIDSTLRGNLGAEIQAAMNATGARLSIVAPAIPAAGRTTVHGLCLVNGVPVADTEFGRDPKTPVKRSSIAEVLAEQTDCRIVNITLEVVRSGHLSESLQFVNGSPQCIVVIDAETSQDLDQIGCSIAELDEKLVLVGAAGLAGALPQTLYRKPRTIKPILVMAGSMSGVTREQINFASDNGLRVVDVNIKDILDNRWLALDVATEMADCMLSQGHHCAIRTSRSDGDRAIARALCEEHGITGTELGNRIAEFMGEVAVQLQSEIELGGILLTGGDIATSMANAVGASGYHIQGEVMPCIPVGHFTGHTLPIVTKAGGFGPEDAITRIVIYLQDLDVE